jgi:hypothetical protein
MKRINITEQQFQNVSQKINHQRDVTSDMKLSGLKILARNSITKAFHLGEKYGSLSLLDLESRKDILEKLNEIISRIDDTV